MNVKVAVVTGSNKGIGFAIVRALCSKFDGDIFLTARDEIRGRNAVEELEKEGLKPKFHMLDISSIDSIKTLALFLKNQYGGIDILINNAAIAYKVADPAPFSEQAENTVKVNFFDTRNVCHELFPLLRPHARVVNVTSYRLSVIPSKELQQKFLSDALTEEGLCELMNQFVNDAKAGIHEENGWGKSAYAVSKVGRTALTFIQHKKFLQDTREDIVVNAVTGSNKGIGFAIARALCSKFDGDILLTARDETRGRNAVKELEKEGLKPKFHLLDISSLNSIKTLASFLKKQYGGIDILVNNAAIAYKVADPAPFSEQAENTIKVNFFDTRNVCLELFPLLRPHARVVNVTSSCGRLSLIPSKELQQKFLSDTLTEEELCELMNQFVNDAKSGVYEEKGWGNSAYVVSKVGMNALTFIQHKKFLNDTREDIVVNAVHPGYVDTDMSSHKGPLTPDQGAIAPAYCALLPPNVESPRGQFIWNDKKVTPWL